MNSQLRGSAWQWPNGQGTHARARSVVCHVPRALEALGSPSLQLKVFVGHARVCVHVKLYGWCDVCTSFVSSQKKYEKKVFV